MSRLAVTWIDVGWGDSIILESEGDNGLVRYALIDCNDTNVSRSSFLFVKRFLELRQIDLSARFPLFDFVLLTHGHADHSTGIQALMSHFGTDWFWYPKTTHGGAIKVVHYANRFPQRIKRHQAVDQTKQLPNFGDVELKVLWPPHTTDGPYDKHNENNNSVVLSLKLGKNYFILTGDCEAENWPGIVPVMPKTGVRLFQVPHHGAYNGVFNDQNETPWLDKMKKSVKLVMSSHIRPHHHPHPSVTAEFDYRKLKYFRTDEHYHITIETDGSKVKTKWSRF